ncbi:hypothetical protein ACF9IK_30420 [Kitasatospora hibisci]|uniref:hypothetical protein n=1 Tax=Kitasatospora hibisci TaxID=3369522 RepID=UPI0037553E4A
MTGTEDVSAFCRAVEARSEEHRKAMDVAVSEGWWAIAGSVLRMELDSLIRVNYLLRNPDTRERILASCAAGKGFKDHRSRIPDADMVRIAETGNPWVRNVYHFGNRLVHLTNVHDYAWADPFRAFEKDEREEVIGYLNHYHGSAVEGPSLDSSATFLDIAAYAPHVLRKIASNLRISSERLYQEVTGDS